MTEIEIPNDQQEDENDISGEIRFRDAVVVNADWTIETINLQITKGNIDLQPRFQRRAAWGDERKSRLIESIIAGMPVPNIVLAESREQRGRFIVIDGKQRLVSISQFFANEYALRGLDIRPDLNGLRYKELPADDKNNFDNSTLRSTVIKNWVDENFLYAIFYRLNSGSLPLSPQELRKALTGGGLIDYIEEYLVASAEFHALFGEGLDKRMRDSELVLRFIAFDHFLPVYDGNFKNFLDFATRHFEEDWGGRKGMVDGSLRRLDIALNATRQIFGQDSFKKWTGEKYERVMNRAVFDCIARYFAEDSIAKAAIAAGAAVTEEFRTLCLDQQFKEAIERTTKSRNATFTRVREWGVILAKIVGRKYENKEMRIS